MLGGFGASDRVAGPQQGLGTVHDGGKGNDANDNGGKGKDAGHNGGRVKNAGHNGATDG